MKSVPFQHFSAHTHARTYAHKRTRAHLNKCTRTAPRLPSLVCICIAYLPCLHGIIQFRKPGGAAVAPNQSPTPNTPLFYFRNIKKYGTST